MKRIFLVLFWALLGGVGGSLIMELGIDLLSDATNPTSKWRVLAPTLLGLSVYLLCFPRAFRAWHGGEFFKEETPQEEEHSPLQNKKAFEYVAYCLIAIVILPSHVKARLIQVIFG